ncbi:hypothetical protein ACFVH0_16295 [Streptomyces sp. NPDC127117]|uniref:hypothetical protein n=1 Tax=Streptomyces sp. NPDC127117 TaxID=3345368 RepID=UPI003628F686
MKGAWKNPAIGSARADIVLTALEAGVALLFIQADNCAEEAVLIAAKFDQYARFFPRQEKGTDGIEKPLRRTRWSAPPCEEYERVHPPALLLFAARVWTTPASQECGGFRRRRPTRSRRRNCAASIRPTGRWAPPRPSSGSPTAT